MLLWFVLQRHWEDPSAEHCSCVGRDASGAQSCINPDKGSVCACTWVVIRESMRTHQMLRDALNFQWMIEQPKFKVFPWTLRGTFTSLRPAAVPLMESCIISGVNIGLSNLTPSNPTLVITFSLENQTRSLCYLLTPFPSNLSCDYSQFNGVWSGLPLHNSENQNLFDLTTSRSKEAMKQEPKVPLFPCPPFFSSPCPNYCRMRSFLSGFPSRFHMHTARQEVLLWCVISFPQQTTRTRKNGYLPLTCWVKAITKNARPAHFYFPGRSCHVLSDLAAMKSVWQSDAQVCTAHINSRRKKRGGKDAWLRTPH